MFRFFKKKSPPPAQPVQPDVAPPADTSLSDEAPAAPVQTPVAPAPAVPVSHPVSTPEPTPPAAPAGEKPVSEAVPSVPVGSAAAQQADQDPPTRFWSRWTSGGKAEETKVSPPVSPDSGQAQTPPPAPVPAAAPAEAPEIQVQTPVTDGAGTQASTPASTPVGSAPAPQAVPEPVSEVVPAAEPTPKKSSWLGRLKQGLARTGQSLGSLFVGVKVDENLFEELESALIMADAGLEATDKLLTALRTRVRKERLDDPAKVKAALRELLADHLRPLERQFDLQKAKPLVVMIAGVNGAGKTTSIGKLAHTFQRQGASVLLAAGDTFRAAAREQLVEWGARNNVSVIAQDGGDPAAVAFDAVNAGRARQMGVVMVDTAGRLPTQLHLMEELKKIRRVIGKADGNAPHEVLLVVDGNTGQNVLAQIRAFDAAINLTGLVVTKLDGTAKGGTLAAVAAGSNGVRPIPVYWIGVGEGMEDLQPFVADEFAAALLSD
ncbi:signal recognition particle-docking protein FtsY [Bordetella sp. 02P26C-1]|nr:signal recognition particle-docking protein FtsY [Bordetella sp. 02P26C-1]MVW80837.1 signal recognition particle-docking protein FtsY [Bordetella sp. 02P26C-1]